MPKKKEKVVKTAMLVQGLARKYKKITEHPPTDGESVILARPLAEGKWAYYNGVYKAKDNIITYSGSGEVQIAIQIRDDMYWIPLPMVGNEFDSIEEEELEFADDYIGYYEQLIYKKRGLPNINELWKCDNFLKTGQASLYGAGLNPPTSEISMLKAKLGSWLKRNEYNKVTTDVFFLYFLENYSDELLKHHIYDYPHLLYCSQP